MQTDKMVNNSAMGEMPISGEDLAQLIFQRPPMVMIDSLIAMTGDSSTTIYLVPETGVFIDENRLSEAGLIENIAQTIAVGVGYNQRKEGRTIPIGYLTMVKGLQILRLPKPGSTLQTEAWYKGHALDFRIFGGKVFCEGEPIAESELRVYVPGNQETLV